jgi:hypothetical protein
MLYKNLKVAIVCITLAANHSVRLKKKYIENFALGVLNPFVNAFWTFFNLPKTTMCNSFDTMLLYSHNYHYFKFTLNINASDSLSVYMYVSTNHITTACPWGAQLT